MTAGITAVAGAVRGVHAGGTRLSTAGCSIGAVGVKLHLNALPGGSDVWNIQLYGNVAEANQESCSRRGFESLTWHIRVEKISCLETIDREAINPRILDSKQIGCSVG